MAVYTGNGLRTCALRGCQSAWEKKPTNMQKKYCGDKHRAEAHAIKELDKEREYIISWLDTTADYTVREAEIRFMIRGRYGLGAGEKHSS